MRTINLLQKLMLLLNCTPMCPFIRLSAQACRVPGYIVPARDPLDTSPQTGPVLFVLGADFRNSKGWTFVHPHGQSHLLLPSLPFGQLPTHSQDGCRDQSPQCEDPLKQVHRLLLFDPYVLPGSARVRTPLFVREYKTSPPLWRGLIRRELRGTMIDNPQTFGAQRVTSEFQSQLSQT